MRFSANEWMARIQSELSTLLMLPFKQCYSFFNISSYKWEFLIENKTPSFFFFLIESLLSSFYIMAYVTFPFKFSLSTWIVSNAEGSFTWLLMGEWGHNSDIMFFFGSVYNFLTYLTKKTDNSRSEGLRSNSNILNGWVSFFLLQKRKYQFPTLPLKFHDLALSSRDFGRIWRAEQIFHPSGYGVLYA